MYIYIYLSWLNWLKVLHFGLGSGPPVTLWIEDLFSMQPDLEHCCFFPDVSSCSIYHSPTHNWDLFCIFLPFLHTTRIYSACLLILKTCTSLCLGIGIVPSDAEKHLTCCDQKCPVSCLQCDTVWRAACTAHGGRSNVPQTSSDMGNVRIVSRAKHHRNIYTMWLHHLPDIYRGQKQHYNCFPADRKTKARSGDF